MRDPVKLTASWILTTEHRASQYGKPVLLDQTTGEGYYPEDTHDFPAEQGGTQTCGRFVARFGRGLSGDDLQTARLFLSQMRGGPQL